MNFFGIFFIAVTLAMVSCIHLVDLHGEAIYTRLFLKGREGK